MEITTCYTVKIKAQMKSSFSGKKKYTDDFAGEKAVSDRLMNQTAAECLSAYKMCLGIFLKRWDEIRQYPSSVQNEGLNRRRFCDLLVHSTRHSSAEYPEFDKSHGRMPAYTRRAIISDALGAVSGYVSNHESWEAADPKERGKEPVLGCPDSYELTFYKQERETSLLESGIIGVKLYDGNEWNWHYFRISMTDAGFIARLSAERKMLSPVIEKKNRRWQIRFSFSEERELTDKDPMKQRILAVDLGILEPATWCVMESDGAVRARGHCAPCT